MYILHMLKWNVSGQHAHLAVTHAHIVRNLLDRSSTFMEEEEEEELRIWKGKAIYKKGTLDLKGHFDQAKGHFVQAKGHQGHPRNFRKGTKAKKKTKKISSPLS